MDEYALLDPVRASNGSHDPEAVPIQPTSVLIGVSDKAAAVLAEIDVGQATAKEQRRLLMAKIQRAGGSR